MDALLQGVQVCCRIGSQDMASQPPGRQPAPLPLRAARLPASPSTLQHDLGKRLAHLSRALQQVASVVREPGSGTGAEAAAAGAAAETGRQDAALQRTLFEAAERIRDFQRRAEHEAQQLQLEGVLQPLRAQHAEEAGRLRQQQAAAEAEMGALCLRAADLEGALTKAAGERDAWQQRAGAAQDRLEASLRQYAASAGALQQQLDAAQAREQQLASELLQAQAAAAAQAASLQQELAAQHATAAAASVELAAAGSAWQEERGALVGDHQRQQAAAAAQLELLRLQAGEAGQQATAQAARAAAAEGQAAELQLEVRMLSAELCAAREEQARMGLLQKQAQQQSADLASRLHAAEEEAAAAQRRGEELQQQLAAASTQQQEQAAAAAEAAEQHRCGRREHERPRPHRRRPISALC